MIGTTKNGAQFASKNFKHSKKLCCLITVMLFCGNCTSASATAISVVESVQNTSATLRNTANEINYKRNNIIYLARIKQWIEDNKTYSQKSLIDQKNLIEELATAQKDLEIAKKQVTEVQKKSSEASKYLLQSGYELSDTGKLIRQIESEIARLDKEIKMAQADLVFQSEQLAAIGKEQNFEADIKTFNAQVENKKEQLAGQILSEVGYDENNLLDAEIKLQETVTKETAEAKNKLEENIAKEANRIADKKQYAAQQIANTYALIDTISKQLITGYNHQEAAYVVHSHAESTKYLAVMETYVSNLKNDMSKNQENIIKLQKEASKLQLDLQNIQKQLLPITDAKYANTQTRFYTWHNDKGHSGQQLYQPVGFYALQQNTEIGIYSGYINSRVKNEGSFSGITDTSLYIGQISNKKPYTITYMMDFRLPTGQSQIPVNSIVSDDLVEYSHLGEGFNWMPGIKLSKQIGEEDLWTAQVRYNIRGNYNYTQGIAITPGDEIIKSLSWQHAGQTWQFLGTVFHTNYTKAQEDKISYRKGNKYDFQATYNKVITPIDSLMFYYWVSAENKNKYYSSIEFPPGGNLYRHYLGTQWLRKLSSKEHFSIMLNTMFSRGDNYDPVNQQRVNKRNKYTLRLSYYLQLSATAQMVFQVERFYMYDGNENSRYRGNNYYLTYSKKI